MKKNFFNVPQKITTLIPTTGGRVDAEKTIFTLHWLENMLLSGFAKNPLPFY